MKIVKLGGSLMQAPDVLKQCLTTIIQNNQGKIVIVPGGGDFADHIRAIQQQWKINDKIAHQMAILAMQQMALLLSSFNPSFVIASTTSTIQKDLLKHAVVIWSPDIKELECSGVRESWDVSSDSLAAWLATHLAATELILVKAAKIPNAVNIEQMQSQGLVDLAFSEYTANSNYKITLINQHCFNEYLFT